MKRTFQRVKLLEFATKYFGEEVAAIIDKHCTITNVSEGVWIYRNKVNESSDDASEVAISDDK